MTGPPAGIRFTDRLTEAQADRLLELFDLEWWTVGRDADGVRRMLAGSTEVVAALDGEELAGFGRSISDGTYRASINDVIVTEAWRGKGLGDAIVAELLARPSVATSNHVDLHCLAELVPYYERFGFSRGDPSHIRMVLKRDTGPPINSPADG